ncbi:hypothetical protein EYF80_024490 [Liparis tanakae]|uniref:Uncharacterized protein n=1 Tax=Liparis tanakae TaxID=230148 RepID=A0A4Z2HJA6_9TELE|nr:hypothetical protein EYF80_024490 [Liparis tanakae]
MVVVVVVVESRCVPLKGPGVEPEGALHTRVRHFQPSTEVSNRPHAMSQSARQPITSSLAGN